MPHILFFPSIVFGLVAKPGFCQKNLPKRAQPEENRGLTSRRTDFAF
jgi:hypothetical protein